MTLGSAGIFYNSKGKWPGKCRKNVVVLEKVSLGRLREPNPK